VSYRQPDSTTNIFSVLQPELFANVLAYGKPNEQPDSHSYL